MRIGLLIMQILSCRWISKELPIFGVRTCVIHGWLKTKEKQAPVRGVNGFPYVAIKICWKLEKIEFFSLFLLVLTSLLFFFQ